MQYTDANALLLLLRSSDVCAGKPSVF